ncbi:hypothetical protein TNCV_1803581 [Trichonephila clavipes]|uniref:Uncharacterized protein n=1 Tax=Trichonephila clavipes TaxID=2585209 RepID=A0A8X6SGN8_TRICX|nr:hypothetical protein TNCV_1803581 [Trichonephila clavipes]
MEKAIEIIQAAEASWEQIRNMKYDTATINFVKENQNKPKIQYNCKKCGRKHKPQECPASGKICVKSTPLLRMVYEACLRAEANIRPSAELAETLSLPERIPTPPAEPE